MIPDKPLDGITVVDAASLYAGPLTAMMLGDFGAEVIKVEHPEYGDSLREFGDYPEELSWKWVNRNKKSVPLDLHEEDGQEIFKDLVADADVLVENFRPGTLEDWGIGWETLSALNETLVMVRVTGFGQTGPYKDRPGFGTLVEAMSGYAYSTGQADGPPTLPPTAMADSICALHSTYAAVMALYWRDVHDGSGQYIDSSILEAMFGMLGDHVIEYGQKEIDHERSGNRSSRTAPRNTYRTKDDRWVAISGSSQSIAERILRIVGGEELATDPRFRTMKDRLEHVEELDAIIAEWMSEHTRTEVIEIFEEHEAAIGPVNNMADIFRDQHFAERDAVIYIDGEDEESIPMRGVFPKLSATPGGVDHPGPSLGSHALSTITERTDRSEADVRRLAAEGVTTLGGETRD
ncbi:CoA transferase [Haloferax mediterranei ATCC 33500]|nr:CoA transferase [Haloferax mediterranei]AHZ22949.1 acyl-CoA transferase [Haloferax mediterranei ATCC 33500]ELZ99877.1 L-carnitine dehydratase/bile acid-inducible protein F / alpha-methylacyl-CoA racemase [Haloferax mediterranei ATCC 33500]MDX5987700.1 CoA transferase [Haloferax mediterranei ATCC 33500]QCQ74185.1 CoA transferase [Haloferax mediterranei ATCC 33500]